ncbi:T9SS type A sorting domain-containing protein [Fulvitalea axinellae]
MILIFSITPLVPLSAQSLRTGGTNTLDPAEKDGLYMLYDSLGGKNWRIGNDRASFFSELKSRTESPFFKAQNGTAIQRGTKNHIREIHLVNNNLSGNLPDSLFVINPDDYGYSQSIMYKPRFMGATNKPLRLSHNKITGVSPLLGIYGTEGPEGVFLDHNELKTFKVKRSTYGVGGIGSKGINGTLDISNNMIKSLTPADLDYNGTESILARGLERLNIANNFLDFETLIKIQKLAVETVNEGRAPYEDKFKAENVTLWPQRKLGEKQPEITLAEGENQDLAFALKSTKNRYRWMLNGTLLPLSEGKAYTVLDLNPEKAGIYTCLVTNPDLPGVTLESVDYPVWLKKDGNRAPADFGIDNDKATPFAETSNVIGTLSGTDPDGDPLHFRFVDTENYRYNNSFRIVSGNTLVTAERIFEHASITEYTINIEAYDPYGGKLRKELVISRMDLPNGVTLIKNIDLSNNTTPENATDHEIGEISLRNGNTDLINEYDLLLPDGQQDNPHFKLEGNKLKTAEPLNYEAKNEYSVLVKAVHKQHPDIFGQELFSVSVSDKNDAPNVIAISANTLKEDDPAGTLVGSLFSVDEDPTDQTFVFELVDGAVDNANFTIQGNSLMNKKKLAPKAYTLRVRVLDDENASFEDDIMVTVLETDDNGGVDRAQPVFMHLQDLVGRKGEEIALTGYCSSNAKLKYTIVTGSEFINLSDGKIAFVKPGMASVKAYTEETEHFEAGEYSFEVTVLDALVKTQAVISHFDNMALILENGKSPLTATTNSDAKVKFEITEGQNLIELNAPYVTPLASGNAKIKAYVPESDTYTSAEKTVSVRILANGEKTDAPITNFDDLSKTMDDPDFALNAYSDSDAKMEYEIKEGNDVIGLDKGLVSIKGPGLATVRAFTKATDLFYEADKYIAIRVARTLGVETETSAISIYPNPAKDQLSFSFPSAETRQIRLRNNVGQCYAELSCESREGWIDVSPLPPGIYILTVDSGTDRKAIKVQITK